MASEKGAGLRLPSAIIALLIFALNIALNWPLFLAGESPYRQSIELGYAGMARFILQHPNPWGWDPLPYCGLPTQYLYLPVVPYLVAGLTWISNAPHEMVYRIFISLLVCAGPVAVFWLVLYFAHSRAWAAVAAFGYTVFSPTYGLFEQIHRDRGITELPWRLQVLVKYGEGPHNVGLALLPLAIIALWAAGTGREYWKLFVAAAILALVTLTNWVAALALAFVFLAFVAAAVRAPDTGALHLRRMFSVAGLAYLLASFWLTPSFIRTIAFNWPEDAVDYRWSNGLLTVGGFFAALVLLRCVLYWFRVEFYRTFLTLCAFGFGWVVARYYLFGVDTVPESHRYAVEFELFLMLALCEWFRKAMDSRDQVKRFCAVAAASVMLLMGFGQARHYLTQGWANWKPVQRETTAEFQVARWLWEQRPAGRVLVSGGTRLRLNSWFDLQQVGGTFESGVRNRKPIEAAYRFRTEPLTQAGTLAAMGVEYVAIHESNSSEYYRDYVFPKKFDGLLERVYADGGNVVYRVPYQGAANPVWYGMNDADLTGTMDGQPLSLPVNYDPGWRATQDGKPIGVERDSFGFLKLLPAPGAQSRIALHYAGTVEQKAFAALSALTWLVGLAWLFRGRFGSQARKV